MIHCNIKPSNIMFVKDESEGRLVAKLCDFGLCAVRWASPGQSVSQSVSQSVRQTVDQQLSPKYCDAQQFVCMNFVTSFVM